VTGAAIATCAGRGLGVCYQLLRLLVPRSSGFDAGSGATRSHSGDHRDEEQPSHAGTERARRRQHRSPGALTGRSQLQLRLRDLRPRWPVLANLARLAATGTLQSLLETTSWLALVRILATFGSAALAGYTIAMRIAAFALLPSWGMANAAATLVGQNLGAARPERAERAVWVVGLYNFVFLGSVGLVFVWLPDSLSSFFTSQPDELRYAAECLRIVALGFLFYAYGMVLVQAINGAGDTRTPTLLNVLAFWCFKIPLAYLLALQLELGPKGVFIAITAAYSGLALMAAFAFRRGTWKTQRV
jgi:Na+-driven multidrug efflux pump